MCSFSLGHYNPKYGQPDAIAPNILNRDFNPTQADAYWAGDITYIRTQQGWHYLAIVMDLYSRRIIGWSFSAKPDSLLTVKALEMAISQRGCVPTLFHSDQGCQYSSQAFRSALKRHGIQQSMSRRGNCWDNAPVERFFASLKYERIRGGGYVYRDDAVRDLKDYILGFYNQRRLHSTLGYLSPADFERRRQQGAVQKAA
jgi:putative transposase